MRTIRLYLAVAVQWVHQLTTTRKTTDMHHEYQWVSNYNAAQWKMHRIKVLVTGEGLSTHVSTSTFSFI